MVIAGIACCFGLLVLLIGLFFLLSEDSIIYV